MHAHALIAEDEPILAETLRAALLRLWPQLQLETVGNGAAAVERALATRPDVLFLDIKMPGKTGLEAAHELAEEWPEQRPFPLVVFVTAYDDYALQAFEHAAVDYVLKPVADERLAKTVARLQQQLEQRRDGGDGLERILGQLRALGRGTDQAAPRLSHIRAGVGNQVRLIPLGEVLYFEADDKYVVVATDSGEALIRTSIKDLLPQLDPDRFWQIHRGTVVNIERVEAALRDETGKLALKLRGHSRMLGVSRVYAHLFRQM